MRLAFPIVAFVASTGNWLTFLALLIYVQTQSGSAASAAFFLCQSLPALLLAGQIARRIPTTSSASAWIAAQLLLAVFTAVAALFGGSLLFVFIYAGGSMLIRSVASPLYMTVISMSTLESERRSVLRGVSSVSAITLAVAPAVGGVLLTTVGPVTLLLLNSLLFALAAVLMLGLRKVFLPRLEAPISKDTIASSKGSWFRLPGISSLVVIEGTQNRVLAAREPTRWLILVLAGALINVLEAPVVFEIIELQQTTFSFMLSAYGVGGFIVLGLSLVKSSEDSAPLSAKYSYQIMAVLAAVSVASLGLLNCLPVGLPQSAVAVLSFGLMGFSVSWLSGSIRSSLDLWAEGKDGVDKKTIWTWTSQVTLAANLIIYFCFFIVFISTGPQIWFIIIPASLYLSISFFQHTK